MKAFFVRLFSGIVLLAIIISAGILGGDVLFALTLAISVIGYLEFLKVFRLEKSAPGIWGFCFLILYYLGLRLWNVENLALFMLLAYLMVLLAVYVFTFPKYKTEEIAEAFLGFVYVPVLLSFIWQTRMLPIEGEDTSLIYFLIFQPIQVNQRKQMISIASYLLPLHIIVLSQSLLIWSLSFRKTKSHNNRNCRNLYSTLYSTHHRWFFLAHSVS